jgi:hypothetical protein
MDPQALQGRYERLRRELATAYQELPWQSSRIDRIAEKWPRPSARCWACRREP